MKVIIELEVPDDFEPYTFGCESDCPSSHYDWALGESVCNYTGEQCPMLNMKERKDK